MATNLQTAEVVRPFSVSAFRFAALTIVAAMFASTMAVVSAGIAATPAAAQAVTSTYVVNSTGDQTDANGADGVCRTTVGTCTLRAAVQQANYTRGANTIRFGLGGSGIRTINVGSNLVFNDPSGGTFIDGYSQSGASVNTAGSGSNANILVVVNGTNTSQPVFKIESAANELRGLSIKSGKNRIELFGESADGNVIAGNFIGIDPNSGESVRSGINYGVLVHLGPDRNVIGGPANADRNIISGNGSGSSGGVRINHGETSQNIVENNVVGLRPNLSDKTTQGIGIDIQYWSWGNHVEGNVVSGHSNFGIDVSHSAVETTVVRNYVGTLGDGNTTTAYTANAWSAIAIKDNPTNNYIAENVMLGGRYGFYGRHHFNGPNVLVRNRVGVGLNGNTQPFSSTSMLVNGYSDIIQDNLFATNNSAMSPVVVVSFDGGNGNYPAHPTVWNRIRQNNYRLNSSAIPIIDLSNRSLSGWPTGTSTQDGFTPNDPGDGDGGVHLTLNTPVIQGIGPGQVNGTACANCTVEVYQSGAITNTGDVNPNAGGTGSGAAWIGRTTANASGVWSLGESAIQAGKRMYVLAIDNNGNTSEMGIRYTVPSNGQGLVNNPSPNLGRQQAPSEPARPPAYQAPTFDCNHNSGTLSWDNDGASEYYVWWIDDNSNETYLGPQTGTSMTVPPAESYRVEHWNPGYAVTATCLGDGLDVQPFTCAVANGVLSWTDVGAPEYYVFASNGGAESYLGGHSATTLNVQSADSLRVEHWATGQATNATCDGAGGGTPGGGTFTCSHQNGVLTWSNAGASEYYVFANNGGTETYLGGHSATTLNVPSADSYRIEHWVTGQVTNATCDGAGAGGQVFTCSIANGVLSWTDVGAAEYYVFASSGGNESYLGGHPSTSLNVPAADSYRVEHWITGQVTNAVCP